MLCCLDAYLTRSNLADLLIRYDRGRIQRAEACSIYTVTKYLSIRTQIERYWRKYKGKNQPIPLTLI